MTLLITSTAFWQPKVTEYLLTLVDIFYVDQALEYIIKKYQGNEVRDERDHDFYATFETYIHNPRYDSPIIAYITVRLIISQKELDTHKGIYMIRYCSSKSGFFLLSEYICYMRGSFMDNKCYIEKLVTTMVKLHPVIDIDHLIMKLKGDKSKYLSNELLDMIEHIYRYDY